MKRTYNSIKYTLTNENIEIGDIVFPIHNVYGEIYFNDIPHFPHTVISIDDEIITTDRGYSEKDRYFKIINFVKKVKNEKI